VFLDSCGEYISTNEYGNVLDAWRVMPNASIAPINVDIIFFLGRVIIIEWIKAT
jgi:hypothetical protein